MSPARWMRPSGVQSWPPATDGKGSTSWSRPVGSLTTQPDGQEIPRQSDAVLPLPRASPGRGRGHRVARSLPRTVEGNEGSSRTPEGARHRGNSRLIVRCASGDRSSSKIQTETLPNAGCRFRRILLERAAGQRSDRKERSGEGSSEGAPKDGLIRRRAQTAHPHWR
jgi:hypothetical protein